VGGVRADDAELDGLESVEGVRALLSLAAIAALTPTLGTHAPAQLT
jgi:hypothetical protein